jgi:hypothetical protein
MKLSQFTDLLQAYPEKPFHLVLPGESVVPVSFHITEVGHVTKKFIDCGGRVHTVQTCQLQAWVWTDTEHRLLAGKMAGVLNLARAKGVLPAGEDFDIEIEYEDTALSQYPVADYTITDDAVVLNLAAKHTDCLAKDVCLPSLPMVGRAVAAGCCGPSCDC